MAACPLAAERVWIEKSQYQDAEHKYFELSKVSSHTVSHVEISSFLFPIRVLHLCIPRIILVTAVLNMCSHFVNIQTQMRLNFCI